eukprot:TRINITY_DN261_c0_g2_i6.p2 TRINITY_DN261_c0_g2~~TRINITY_DN261_c0_g2_i6.p2  ORF type:complete len:287 (+),score=49.32 TRINITY_DN261_c0_g2_i6:153-1013(+)
MFQIVTRAIYRLSHTLVYILLQKVLLSVPSSMTSTLVFTPTPAQDARRRRLSLDTLSSVSSSVTCSSGNTTDDEDDNKELAETDVKLWACKRCTFLNEEKDNFYNCEMCDVFQPRSAALPHEYQMGHWDLVCLFPERATNLMRVDYYQFYLTKHAPQHSVLPVEINAIISSYLVYCYDVGDSVDVMYQRVWYSAEVVERKDEQLLISYDGWGDQWNEWVDYDSPRLEPHRSKSVGDTSAPKMRHLFKPKPFCADANLVSLFPKNTLSVDVALLLRYMNFELWELMN